MGAKKKAKNASQQGCQSESNTMVSVSLDAAKAAYVFLERVEAIKPQEIAAYQMVRHELGSAIQAVDKND